MKALKTNLSRAIAWASMVAVLWLVSYSDGFSQNSEAEQNYQRFLVVYRQNNPTKYELKNALSFLETANLLSPNTYKYVFSLGALNTTLGNWRDAAEWLDKAKSLSTTKEQRKLIQSELSYCRAQQAILKVRGYGGPGMYGPGMYIRFEMKEDLPVMDSDMNPETVEMDPDIIEKLPRRLPAVIAGDSVQELIRELGRAIDGVVPRSLYQPPYLVVALDQYDSPKEHYENGIKDFNRYFKKHYFHNPPTRVLTTVISPRPHKLVEATNRLYPGVGLRIYAPFLGYYNQADNLIMATGGRAGYGTLLHEMIHALMAADFPAAPAWLNEGMASLYERTRWHKGRLEALPNWRMDRLNEGRVPSLQLLAQPAPQAGLHTSNVALIRLFLLLLDQRQQMDDLYAMVKKQGSNFSLLAAFEQLDLKEEEWRRFVAETFREYRAEIALGRSALSNPDEVQFVQQALNQIMGAKLSVDGLWGPSTQKMLVEFQRRFGLQPDGIFGSKTSSEIRRRYSIVLVNTLEQH